MTDLFALNGRRALVTGASAGIGRALALGLAGQGADLLLHHHRDPDGAAAVAGEITRLGRKAEIVETDFLKDGAAEELAGAALAGGPVDILIANAAMEVRCPWGELDRGRMQAHFSVNFLSLVALSQVLLPQMQARCWGRVVAIGSVMASRPRAETLAYAALKSAQLTAIRALARDVGGSGVTLNVIAPGAIETEATRARYADPAFVRAVTAKIPAGRQGRPEDCVGPVLMLCGEAGSYVTGASIPVDGGWTIGDALTPLPEVAGSG